MRPTRLIALSSLLALSACFSGLKSNEPVQQTYVLEPSPAAQAAAGVTAAGAMPGRPRAAAQTLQVDVGMVAPGLGTDAIALLRPGERLDYYHGVRWAASAPLMLQTLAIDALREQRRFSMVEAEAGPFASGWLLNLELRHFEAEYTDAGPPTIHIVLVCTLGRRSNRDTEVAFTAESRVKADADRMQAVIAAFERGAGEVMAQVAANIAPSEPPAPEPAGPQSPAAGPPAAGPAAH
jgi:cholesterol transport system auxiliary component